MIRVAAAAGAYEIHCRWGALDDLGGLMRDAGLSRSAFIISDDVVGPLFEERTRSSLQAAGFEVSSFTFPSG